MEHSLWIYLSPHLDDAAFSCGGLIWEQVQAGAQVEIWSVCTADPPLGPLPPFALSIQQRWGTKDDAMSIRRAEDSRSARRLGAGTRHLGFTDCIYRRLPGTGEPIINGEYDLWQPLHREELSLVDDLTAMLASLLPASARLVIPMGIGGHVDHRLTHKAGEGLPNRLFYYPDFPYAADVDIQKWVDSKWGEQTYAVSPAALFAWQDAIAANASQISTFWQDEAHMRRSLERYWHNGGGCSLFRA